MRKVADICQTTIWIAMALYAFLLPWGVTGTQIALGIAALAWLVKIMAERHAPWVGRPVGWPVLVFFALFVLACIVAWVPKESVRELFALRTLLAIFLVATNLRDTSKLRRLALVLVGSLTLFSLYAVSARLAMVACERPIHVPLVVSKARVEEIEDYQKERREEWERRRKQESGEQHDQNKVGERDPLGAAPSGFWLPDLGSMSEAGQLAMGLPIALALLLAEGKRKLRWALLVALILIGANLILNMKRGAWGACMAALVVFAVVDKRRVVLAVLFAFIAAMVLVPLSRARIVQAFAGDDGQRLKLWASVPKVVRGWPLGVGPGCSYYAIENKTLVPRAVYEAMPHKDHFHSTIAELAVTAGPLSVGAFLWWMGAFGVWTVRRLRRMPRDDLARPIVLGGLVAATAFFANGIFEYNLGDSDVTLMLYLTMGMAMAAAPTRTTAPSANQNADQRGM